MLLSPSQKNLKNAGKNAAQRARDRANHVLKTENCQKNTGILPNVAANLSSANLEKSQNLNFANSGTNSAANSRPNSQNSGPNSQNSGNKGKFMMNPKDRIQVPITDSMGGYNSSRGAFIHLAEV